MLTDIPEHLVKKIHLANFTPLKEDDIHLLQQCVSPPARPKPLVVIGVEGGVVQGASATTDVEVMIVDHDIHEDDHNKVWALTPEIGEDACQSVLEEGGGELPAVYRTKPRG